MNADLDKKLCEKYPKIFADRNKPMTETAMCWGFEHDDGWYNIIDTMCYMIQNHIDNREKQHEYALKFNMALQKAIDGDNTDLVKYFCGDKEPNELTLKRIQHDIATKRFVGVVDKIPQVVATQVKEKFGGLRFYYNGGDEYIDGITAMAEAMAEITCETCGKPGKKTNHGWIRTLCDEHNDSN